MLYVPNITFCLLVGEPSSLGLELISFLKVTILIINEMSLDLRVPLVLCSSFSPLQCNPKAILHLPLNLEAYRNQMAVGFSTFPAAELSKRFLQLNVGIYLHPATVPVACMIEPIQSPGDVLSPLPTRLPTSEPATFNAHQPGMTLYPGKASRLVYMHETKQQTNRLRSILFDFL